jgi:hypothetical protein
VKRDEIGDRHRGAEVDAQRRRVDGDAARRGGAKHVAKCLGDVRMLGVRRRRHQQTPVDDLVAVAVVRNLLKVVPPERWSLDRYEQNAIALRLGAGAGQQSS